MNKKLMAVAVAGALAAPALAFAQASTVQLYGKVTYEYGYVDQGGARPNTDVAQVPGGTAVGFKGEEKLGGGLSAWFQCESSADVRGMNADGFCTRNSAIGLKGAFGNLHFGRWDTPFKRAVNMGTVGVQDTGLLGHSFVFAGGSGGTNAIETSNRNRWKRRDVAMTYYESPNFSGFQVLAAFTPGNAAIGVADNTPADTPRVASIAGTYKNGPIAVGVGYERHSDFSKLATVGAVNAAGTGFTAATAASQQGDDRAWNISAAYTFAGKVKVGIAYLDAKYDLGAGTSATKKNWNLGLDWAIAGPHGLELGYTRAGDTKGTAGATPGGDIAGAGSDTGAKLYAVKYRYAFSKRTAVRLGYVKLDNDNNAKYALGGMKGATGVNQSAWVMYADHKF
jgi:predicted porin